MEHAETREQKSLTANLYILTQRVLREPIHRDLRIWENLALTGPHNLQAVIRAMSEDAAPLASAGFYVVRHLAPGLLYPVNYNGVRREKEYAIGDPKIRWF